MDKWAYLSPCSHFLESEVKFETRGSSTPYCVFINATHSHWGEHKIGAFTGLITTTMLYLLISTFTFLLTPTLSIESHWAHYSCTICVPHAQTWRHLFASRASQSVRLLVTARVHPWFSQLTFSARSTSRQPSQLHQLTYVLIVLGCNSQLRSSFRLTRSKRGFEAADSIWLLGNEGGVWRFVGRSG